MMPRMLVAVALAAFAGCRFDADYAGGHYQCSNGVCPSGLFCNGDGECAPLSELDAAPPDGPPAALTCVEPGVIVPGAERTFTGDTTGETNKLSTPCDSRVMNGPDDVYAGTAVGGENLHVVIETTAGLSAYVITDCVSPPPACVTDNVATSNFALDVSSLPAGNFYLIVDSDLAAVGGSYTLRVTLGP